MQQVNARQMQACIDACQKCHNVCLRAAFGHCLEMGGKHVEPGHFRLMLDCAEVCQSTANFMLRRSDFHDQLCLECATLCDYCAQSCAQLSGMTDCVEACRNCAESCHQMAVAMI